MQLFLLGYILISICEIFSVGEFPLNKKVRDVCHVMPLRGSKPCAEATTRWCAGARANSG